MDKRVEEAIERVSLELSFAEPSTMSGEYIQFIEDVWVLIAEIQRTGKKS